MEPGAGCACIYTELSSWQNCKAWDSLFHIPFTPAAPFPSLLLLFIPISFLYLFPILSRIFLFRSPSQSGPQLGDLGERSKLFQAGRQRIFESLWAKETHLVATIFVLLSSAEEVNISSVVAIGRLFTNGWDFKLPAWECEKDLECVSVTLNARDLISMHIVYFAYSRCSRLRNEQTQTRKNKQANKQTSTHTHT